MLCLLVQRAMRLSPEAGQSRCPSICTASHWRITSNLSLFVTTRQSFPGKTDIALALLEGVCCREHKPFLALEDQPMNGWLTFNFHTWLVSLLEYSFCSFLMSAKTGAAGPFRDVPFYPKRYPCSQPCEMIRGSDSVFPTLPGKAMQ